MVYHGGALGYVNFQKAGNIWAMCYNIEILRQRHDRRCGNSENQITLFPLKMVAVSKTEWCIDTWKIPLTGKKNFSLEASFWINFEVEQLAFQLY